MHVNVRVIGQELLNRFGFMGGEVVGDHVDLFGFGLTGDKLSQKLDKLSTAMTVLPNTSPVRVLKAAYSERVP